LIDGDVLINIYNLIIDTFICAMVEKERSIEELIRECCEEARREAALPCSQKGIGKTHSWLPDIQITAFEQDATSERRSIPHLARPKTFVEGTASTGASVETADTNSLGYHHRKSSVLSGECQEALD